MHRWNINVTSTTSSKGYSAITKSTSEAMVIVVSIKFYLTENTKNEFKLILKQI